VWGAHSVGVGFTVQPENRLSWLPGDPATTPRKGRLTLNALSRVTGDNTYASALARVYVGGMRDVCVAAQALSRGRVIWRHDVFLAPMLWSAKLELSAVDMVARDCRLFPATFCAQ